MQPNYHSVIGSMSDLSNVSVADDRSFFNTYYAPNNAVLVVAGDIDAPQAKAMVQKYFGPIPAGPTPPPLANMRAPTIVAQEQRLVVQDAQPPAPALFVSYRVPYAKDSRAPAIALLGDIIGAGR